MWKETGKDELYIKIQINSTLWTVSWERIWITNNNTAPGLVIVHENDPSKKFNARTKNEIWYDGFRNGRFSNQQQFIWYCSNLPYYKLKMLCYYI